MGYLGSLVGEGLGKIGGSLIGGAFGNRDTGENVGSQFGKWAGSYLPFKKGGELRTWQMKPGDYNPPTMFRKGGLAEMDGYRKGGMVASNDVPLTMDYMNRVISPPQRLYGNRMQV